MILNRMGFADIISYDIAGCHRLFRRPGKKALPVIIRFINRKHAADIRRAKHMLKIKPMPFPGLYITENLVAPRRRIYDKLRHLELNGDIKELWTYNGSIFFRDKHDSNEKPKKVEKAEFNSYFRCSDTRKEKSNTNPK